MSESSPSSARSPERSDPEALARDPFQAARADGGVLRCPFQGENIPMLLRHDDVRRAARDWSTFSSDAPFRVPIPSEEAVRTMRQLPIETDPPEHTEYRAIVEPFFQRARRPEVVAAVEALISRELARVLAGREVEVVGGLALPVQALALTHLLNVPESEARIWQGWGIHVFKVTGGQFKRGSVLEDYLQAKFDAAQREPGEDFFSALTRATYRGRPLSREEMMGFGNLTFAGGRDTIIHTITSIFAYLARCPGALEALRTDPGRATLAAEEFFRVFMPLTHIGRVCPVATAVGGQPVPPQGRVALGWASANFDEAVFPAPHEIRLDRRPNPHVSFGFGAHLCLGAAHARLIVRSLLQELARQVGRITVREARENVEREAAYERMNGYGSLTVSLEPARPAGPGSSG